LDCRHLEHVAPPSSIEAAFCSPLEGIASAGVESVEKESVKIGHRGPTDSEQLRAIPMIWRRGGTASRESETAFDLAAVIDDDIAFRHWYDMTAPRVYAYLYSRTGSASTAEELTQETFIEVVRKPRTFDGRSDALPWVIGVARHRLSRHFRRAKLDSGRSDNLVREIEVAGDDTRPWRTVEQRDDVMGALGALASDQRAALMLRFVDGLSVKGVATTLGRSEDATESLIRRARQAFETAYRGASDAPR
jgi:RNA polymerase sigma-70 factor (ECF subfamily)